MGERRSLMRDGRAHPTWRIEPRSTQTQLTRLESHVLLLQRYRFVELAKAAGIVGLLMCTSGAEQGQLVADRLEHLLRVSGRRVYRFIVGRLTPEKLGNFPEVECYVSLAGPENFPFAQRDFHVSIVSPYELEVALGVREWTGDYITDLDELLMAPMLRPDVGEEAIPVQILGAKTRLKNFNTGTANQAAALLDAFPEAAEPALVTEGLQGVASKYASDLAKIKD